MAGAVLYVPSTIRFISVTNKFLVLQNSGQCIRIRTLRRENRVRPLMILFGNPAELQKIEATRDTYNGRRVLASPGGKTLNAGIPATDLTRPDSNNS